MQKRTTIVNFKYVYNYQGKINCKQSATCGCYYNNAKLKQEKYAQTNKNVCVGKNRLRIWEFVIILTLYIFYASKQDKVKGLVV